jgi:rhodanese-related sulfurtransferase
MDITVQELYDKLKAGEKFVFIDVREPYEYEEFHIRDSQLIPLNTLISNLDPLEDHKDDEVIVYCRSGARSGTASMVLRANGFSNVRNTTGGILAWLQAFGPTQP